MKERIWAFDLGIGSMGEAVREDNRFLHVASHLIPAEYAETKSAASRRRMWRTRQAHKARERWLNQCMEEAGIEVLQPRRFKGNAVIPGDERLEREFPPAGEEVCYNGAALRILLLQGNRLEGWQVYKALHAAIQRRGYGKVDWESQGGDEDEENSLTESRANDFEQELEQMVPGKSEFHFPCYFEASQLGLWSPEHPDKVNFRIDHTARRARGKIYPRALVEKEIRALIEAAAKQFSKLSGKANYILYGPAGKAYASYDSKLRKEFGLKRGSDGDWQGVLGQKIPKFDNRIISKCILIPRLNVCKIYPWKEVKNDPRKRLPQEFSFLMKLKNMRFQRGGKEDWLSAAEIKEIYEKRLNSGHALALKPSLWAKECEQLGGHPKVGHEEVEEPKNSGRARFCRPALELFAQLILSGESPSAFRQRVLKEKVKGNKDPRKGLTESDLDFLKKLSTPDQAGRPRDSWESIHIPNEKLEVVREQAASETDAICKIIGEVNDPVVRHRLTLFHRRIDDLVEKYGVPEQVVLEFVREDFLGKKAKAEYTKAIKERAKHRKENLEKAKKAGQQGGGSGLRMELYNQQKGICIYTGKPLIVEKLDEYQIDHIVPQAQGGPGAVINYVLTYADANHPGTGKGDRVPYRWFEDNGMTGWDAYLDRVRQRAGTLGNKKVKLLTSPQAAELAEKYTALAETAWISKLAQSILSIKFGWHNGIDSNGNKRVRVISGGLTARVRERYALDGLLVNEGDGQGPVIIEKNRKDPRHHALDAMVLTYIPAWARDKMKAGFFRFPKSVGDPKALFAHYLDEVVPAQLCFERAQLEETIYGVRHDEKGHPFPVLRRPLKGLAYKGGGQQVEYDQETLREQIDFYSNPVVREKVIDWNREAHSEDEWKVFCSGLDFSTLTRSAYSTKALTAIRKALRDLAYRPAFAFDTRYLRKNIENIWDPTIRRLMLDWFAEDRKEPEWVDFCRKVRLPAEKSKTGPAIHKVLLKVGEMEGYADLSPTGSEGFYRKAKAPYPGQFLYVNAKGVVKVRPVYAFESKRKVRQELEDSKSVDKVLMYLQSGCQIRLERPVEHGTTPLKAGLYKLNTLRADGFMIVTDPKGNKSGAISAKKFVEAGLKRI